jgi:hypothetical protein
LPYTAATRPRTVTVPSLAGSFATGVGTVGAISTGGRVSDTAPAPAAMPIPTSATPARPSRWPIVRCGIRRTFIVSSFMLLTPLYAAPAPGPLNRTVQFRFNLSS